jgi:hypothetical protein
MDIILQGLAEQAPWLVDVIFWIGFARLVMKPIMTAVGEIIDLTPTQADDAFWDKVLESKIYKGLVFALDYVASVKLPKKTESK